MRMSPSNITSVISGVNGSLSLFYTIGGSILVVCAAIWGFKKVLSLLGSHRTAEQQIMDREQKIYTANDNKYS